MPGVAGGSGVKFLYFAPTKYYKNQMLTDPWSNGKNFPLEMRFSNDSLGGKCNGCRECRTGRSVWRPRHWNSLLRQPTLPTYVVFKTYFKMTRFLEHVVWRHELFKETNFKDFPLKKTLCMAP